MLLHRIAASLLTVLALTLMTDARADPPAGPGTAHLTGYKAAPQLARQNQTHDQNKSKKKKKPRPPFKWVNKLNRNDLPGLRHATFKSPSMKLDVGYCIYLPAKYDAVDNSSKRYPVVYYLHGGRPGSETKSVSLVPFIHQAQEAGKIGPTIYVFVNGGPVSHYNLPDRENAMGEDIFIKELIPHIDKTYRTIASRSGRALEGFSQGGRGTARMMFKHPELFCSAAPGGGGYATEKRISENKGQENPNLVFAIGYNTWDLARQYAKDPKPAMRRLIFVGNKGFNYENNLQYMKFLDSLKIPYQRLIVPDAPHSAKVIYEKRALQIMGFHAESFRLAGESKN